MKYIIIFFSLLSNSLLAEVKDFGEIATSYPIAEKSIVESFEKGIKEINSTEIKNQLLDSFEKLIIPTFSLPSSTKEETFTKEDIVYLDHDILTPLGTVQYKKGMKLNTTLPRGYKENLCFLDAKHEAVVPLIVEEFKSCTYIVTNRDIREMATLINKQYKVGMVYPMQGKFIKRFNITKLPVKITLYENKIEYHYLNMVELIEKAKKEALLKWENF